MCSLYAEPPLFLFHIPKCGGTTAHALIAQKFHEKEIYHILGHNEFFMKFDEFEGIKFFTGHIEYYYGKLVVPEMRSITFLRDPLDRIVSQYQYSYRMETTPPSFRDFAKQNSNLQVAMLSGYPPGSPNVTLEEHLESAKNNLKDFFFVGIVERLPESINALFKLLEWPAPEETPNFNPSQHFGNSYQNYLSEVAKENWADFELYQFAKQIFEEKLALTKKMENKPPEIEFVDHIHYTFDQPLDGTGWQYREYSDSLCIRTTYRLEAHIFFPLKQGTHYLMGFTASSPPNEILNELQVLINGTPVRLKRLTFSEWSRFIAAVPKELITKEKTKITFKVPDLYSHSDPQKRRFDPRNYGVRVAEINISGIKGCYPLHKQRRTAYLKN